MSLEYGIIGNCKTAALVSERASIDWLCFPRFDSPSIFAKLLDKRKGGSFSITGVGRCETRQEYVEDTNVLKTVFKCNSGSFEVYDFFPHYHSEGNLLKDPEIYRIIKVLSGKPEVVIKLNPKFEYGAKSAKPEVFKDYACFTHKTDSLYVYTNLDIRKVLSGEKVTLRGDSHISISYNDLKEGIEVSKTNAELSKTISYWEKWIQNARLPKRQRNLVARSALTLKLLTYDDSGAIVAAPTTSIPEIIGETRNWDYRYCWIRDASFTVLALVRLAEFDVAYGFVNWLCGIYSSYGINSQVLFDVNGGKELTEKTLPHLAGYMDSKPVRIGNAASEQKQLDIFGDALDAMYLFYIERDIGKMTEEVEWKLIYGMVESAIRDWREKDQSIWEFRTKRKQYTFSKVLCWVAVDRGVKIARRFRKRHVIKRWSTEADKIKADVLKHGWNPTVNSFTQSYHSSDADASLLLLPYFGFIDYSDEKMRSTVAFIKKELFDGTFMMRYKCEDDFGNPKNAFVPCAFWLMEALNGIGQKEEAQKLFEQFTRYANHLGLLSEDVDRKTGQLLGNFPQAYSHIALINAAISLYGFEDDDGDKCDLYDPRPLTK